MTAAIRSRPIAAERSVLPVASRPTRRRSPRRRIGRSKSNSTSTTSRPQRSSTRSGRSESKRSASETDRCRGLTARRCWPSCASGGIESNDVRTFVRFVPNPFDREFPHVEVSDLRGVVVVPCARRGCRRGDSVPCRRLGRFCVPRCLVRLFGLRPGLRRRRRVRLRVVRIVSGLSDSLGRCRLVLQPAEAGERLLRRRRLCRRLLP